MDSEKLVFCSHCNKEVAKANYDLHEPHCMRFLCKCPECDDTVPRDQLEEHKTEQHAEVKCKMCHKKMEKRDLLDHERDECPKRPQICEFCQLELPMGALTEHRVSCGSRTELCTDCGRYVQLKDQLDHPQNCSTHSQTAKDEDTTSSDSDEESMLQCENCLIYMPSYSLEKHKQICKQPLEFAEDEFEDESDFKTNLDPRNASDSDTAEFSFSSRKTKKIADKRLDEINTCPFCHLALPVKTLQWHEKKCELYKQLNPSKEGLVK